MVNLLMIDPGFIKKILLKYFTNVFLILTFQFCPKIGHFHQEVVSCSCPKREEASFAGEPFPSTSNSSHRKGIVYKQMCSNNHPVPFPFTAGTQHILNSNWMILDIDLQRKVAVCTLRIPGGLAQD